MPPKAMNVRSEALQAVAVKEFDLVVIGGGIAGAGVAQDAASRGMSVALIERDDFASGTSSRTTKLVHGGLRYLEQLQFGLTWQLCQERALLEQVAPHMVRTFSFVVPLLKDNLLFSLKARAGLTIYDLVSWLAGGGHHHESLGRREVLEAVPALSPGAISGGLRFYDCITDDARLVVEVVKSACREGAIAINYLEVCGFQIESGKITAVKCHDRYHGGEIVVRCKTCVNAAGVWSDDICRLLMPSWASRVAPSKGTHIIVPQSAFETNTALFLPTDDKRYVFVVPWQRALMIGTTDTPYSGVLDQPLPEIDEIDYLLAVVNEYAGTRRLGRADVAASFSGLRPLIRHEGFAGATSQVPREHLIGEGPYGIICLTGGKLTNYRLMAAEVVDSLLGQFQAHSIGASRTKTLMLGGWADKRDFLLVTAAISAKARRLGIEPATLDHLISSYGADAQVIVDIVEQDPQLNERLCPDFPPIMAEIPFCVTEEMAVCLEDVLMRRLRLGVLNHRQCLAAAPRVASAMKMLLSWDNVRTSLELNALEQALGKHMDLVGISVASGSGT